MTHPKILKAERFGCSERVLDGDLACLGCGCQIDMVIEEYVFDRFGRIFCSEGCLIEYFCKERENF